jgi:endoribonuclease LACTB2
MVFQVTSSSDPSEVGALFTADNVLGHGTAVFEDLGLYLDSLQVMKQRLVDSQSSTSSSSSGSTKRAYPGHGAVIEDGVAKIDEYIAHRRMREEEALNVLRYGTVKAPHSSHNLVADSITRTGESDASDNEAASSKLELGAGKEVVSGKEWTSLEMVKVIYRHYPENLWEPAERGLLMVLNKLKGDGKVIHVTGQEGGGGAEKGRWRASEKATL